MARDASRSGIPPEAEEAFVAYVARLASGEEFDFEELCREHAPIARELRALNAHWSQVSGIIERLAPGSLSSPGSLAERIRERFGSQADRQITLEAKHEGGAAETDFVSELVQRLSGRGGSFGRYELRGELARGGQGVILRVWDEDLRRNLAMKVVLGQGEVKQRGDTPQVDSRTLGRFLEEAQVTGQLDHPGIVPVHELGLDAGGRVYFTMKLVKGRDLKAIFGLVHAQSEGWNETRALGVVLKVCEAMAYAHAKGVIHRDLKPANVMVGRYGEVYVMDWGLARVLGREDDRDLRIRPALATSEVRTERHEHAAASPDSPLMTMDGDVMGTPAYMSPEQARGDLAAMGPASDVYALGAMLYHLLAGHAPYVPAGARLNNYAIWALVQQGPPTSLSALAPGAPAELVAICERAMAREAADRYADTEALAEDLRAFLEYRVVGAYETGAIAELRKWVGRNKPLAAALAASIVLAIGGLGGIGYVQAKGKEAAQEQEQIATKNAEEAQRQAEVARRERANVLRLSAFQRLEDLQGEADELWPPWPEHLDAYDAWLSQARDLVAGLDPSADGRDAGHRAQLAELEARALPRTAAEREVQRRSHPRLAELAPLEEKLAACERAQAVREGKSGVEEVALDEAAVPADANGLNALAWDRVAPDRTLFGEEARGLALALRAFERAGDGSLATIGDTLARAFLANGLDDDAVALSEEALAAAGGDQKAEYQGYLDEVQAAVAAARSGEARAALEAQIDELETELSRRRSWRFAADQDRWWRAQLEKLVVSIEAFADPETGLMPGVSPEVGWGIQRRRDWAASVAERTVTGEEAAGLWAAAISSIADEAECPAYGGLEIEPQLGLVPIGRDPHSGLWEFAHPLTGEPAQRDEDGKLVLTEDMGLVFVLLPGGKFSMGARSSDPQKANYDPQAVFDEGPVHEVELSAFFLSKYEMTQGQWQRFTGENPSFYPPETYKRLWNVAGLPGDLLHPVEQVSWSTCTEAQGRLGLVLPSEEQWEYGARGGTTSVWWTGDEKESLSGAANLADHFARGNAGYTFGVWEDWDDGNTTHARVGSYTENDFGLLDVAGNVGEWCRDGYDGYFYRRGPQKDPLADPAGYGSRVFRGGNFSDSAVDVRSANRNTAAPEAAGDTIGLRPARVITGFVTTSRPSSGASEGR